MGCGFGVAGLPALEPGERVLLALGAADLDQRVLRRAGPGRLYARGLAALLLEVRRPGRVAQPFALVPRREIEQRLERAVGLVDSGVNHFDNGGKVNTGAVLRWVDDKNWYKALIDGAHLQLLSRINGTSKSLATMAFPAQDGVSYTLRFRVVGANLFAKAWPANQPEPAAWMVTVTDTALTQGMGGIRVVIVATQVDPNASRDEHDRRVKGALAASKGPAG